MNGNCTTSRRGAAPLGLSFVAFSLSTFSYRAAALAYLLFFIYLVVARRLSVPKLSIPLLLGFIALNGLAFGVSVRHDVHALYVVKYAGLSFYFLMLLVYRKIIPAYIFIRACRIFLYVHSASLAVQLLWFIAAGSFLDFDDYIREDHARTLYTSQAMEGLIIPIRATGFFSEPSFFSMTVFPVTLLLTMYEKRISAATILGTITSFISFSVAGIIVTSLGATLFVFSTKTKVSLKIGFLAVMLAMAPIAYEVYKRRVVDAVDYDAVGSRMLVIDYLKRQPFAHAALGNGLLWDENKPIGKTGLRGMHTRDTSFFVYAYFTTGAIGVVVLFLLLFFSLRRRPTLLLSVLISFLFKYGILVSSLWLIIAVAICLSSYGDFRRTNSTERAQD